MARKKSGTPKMQTASKAQQDAGLKELPAEVRSYLKKRESGSKQAATLEAMLPGSSWLGVRQSLRQTGVAQYKDDQGQDRMLVADFDEKGKLMAVAAAIPRNPGKSFDFLSAVEDFTDTLTSTKNSRKDFLALAHRIYRNDGTTNNAITKLSALIAPSGAFKVRSVKGQRGKSGDKVAEEFQFALNWWKDNVNAGSESSVITGAQGVTSFITRGVRLAFIEGDHIARHLWPKKKVPIPGAAKTLALSLPMNLQTFSAADIEIPDGLQGTDYEFMYWVPPQAFVRLLRDPKDPALKKVLDSTIPSDVKSALIKNGKYLLDPSLCIHIKHKGTGIDTFGESLIEPTLADIRYKKALDALEITTITNLINRMVIVKVGSDNPDSNYHTAGVSAKRLTMLQRMMRNVGPSSVILWGGPDIEVVEVGAHNSILELDGRWKIAERRHLMSLGLPAILMIGEGNDGKAAGFSAALGVAAQLKEIQDQYANCMTRLAKAIGDENGYEEVDVVWEFHDNLLEDKQAAAEIILKMFDRGLASTQTATEELGFDYDAERVRQDSDVKNKYKDEAFGPPKSMTALAATAGDAAGGGEGRPTRKANPSNTSDPRNNKETKQKAS